MNDILCRQIAIDYCCSPENVRDHQNHFTVHKFLEGRRRFQEGTECFLKIAVINGKLLFSGNKDIIGWCREHYQEDGSEWFLEAKNLRKLNNRLHQFGYQIETVHPFFIAERISSVSLSAHNICWYFDNDIEQFRNDVRFNEAFAFCEDAPDVIGVSAIKGEQILGMAGASCDSPSMWQIGINVNSEARQTGLAKMLVCLLKNEILRWGILPYYGTSVSHLISQRVALSAGFVPAWVELKTSMIEANE